MEIMRLKVGTQVISNMGYTWRITHINRLSGLVELEDETGIRFHILKDHLRHHGKKVGFFKRLFKKDK